MASATAVRARRFPQVLFLRVGNRRDERRVERPGSVETGRFIERVAEALVEPKEEPVPQDGSGIVRPHGLVRP